MICELSNEFVRFCLYFEKNINFNQLQKFFGAYASIKKINYLSSEYDLFVSFVSPKSGAFSNSANLIDNYIMKHDKNALYVGIENYNLEEIVFIKRLLIDLINRFFEYKGGLFLHSSSIVDGDKSIVFIGDKGAGKTTTMLYLLNDYHLAYSSNERTGLMQKNGNIISYGNPARINIRANTLQSNESLKNKIWDCIDHDKYKIYSEASLSRNCSERLVVHFSDLEEKLGVKIIPTSKLSIICNLIYNKEISFKCEKINYLEMKRTLEDSVINGVFPQRTKLNEYFPTQAVDFNSLFDREEISYYNIYQDNSINNSSKIYKMLKKEIKDGRN